MDKDLYVPTELMAGSGIIVMRYAYTDVDWYCIISCKGCIRRYFTSAAELLAAL